MSRKYNTNNRGILDVAKEGSQRRMNALISLWREVEFGYMGTCRECHRLLCEGHKPGCQIGLWAREVQACQCP